MRIAICLFAFVLVFVNTLRAQSPNATVNGQVLDTSGGLIADATVEVVNEATNASSSTKTNSSGIYLIPDLPPATYRIQVSHLGFKTIVKPDVILNVRDAVAINFTLPIGAISEMVTVEGGTPLINTQDATVSTVVDRQFAENLPMNGRSFQTLIGLAPGVVVATSSINDSGQFTVNGQRANSNYWMVDGVSANISMSPYSSPGGAFGGMLGGFSALGGTNSLVSVDAMQEFRIETSSYAPEFGRTPGGQISIVTRSGTNAFHGTIFDYFRNDALDANNWFNTAVTPEIPKAKERQNDFGGTFSGPIAKDRTFFFFSYEGLRLDLPQSSLTSVPDTAARQNAIPSMRAYLNAYPLPSVNATDDTATGIAQFNASYSDPATLDAYSLRIDHKIGNRTNVFGRYNHSPSQLEQRGGQGGQALSDLFFSNIATQTGTVGATVVASPTITNDVRFNYSRTNGFSKWTDDDFGGAVPLSSLPFPGSFNGGNASLFLEMLSIPQTFEVGASSRNLLQQFNLVDTVAVQRGAHGLKFGLDYRRVTASRDPFLYQQTAFFLDVPSATNGDLLEGVVEARTNSTFLLRNLGLFAQDTWRLSPQLTLTYGVRWDIDFVPTSTTGTAIPAVTGYDLNDFSHLTLASPGTAAYQTTHGNFAPRIGAAYQISQNPNWGTVLRGGFGVFYDLASSELGNLLGFSGYPFSASNAFFGPAFGGTSTFPFSLADSVPPPITASSLGTGFNTLTAFDPHLQLPYTLEWNIALQQQIGAKQSITASYIGASGQRLIQSTFVFDPNPNFVQADLVGNNASSNYNALQLQFQRRLSAGLQVLASYTWSHSIDDASAGSYANAANTFVPGINPGQNRGPSDFDIRNSLSIGLTYNLPSPTKDSLSKAVLSGWSLDSVIQARSSPPVNIYYSGYSELLGASAAVRPNLTPGIPLYLYGSQYPGGKVINNTPGAVAGGCPDGSQSIGPFCPPASTGGVPLVQGNLGRNSLRGFGASQWDFAVHREFPIRETTKLEFRAEVFNLLNHPNFAPPIGDLVSPGTVNPQFGRSTETLAQSLGANVGTGGFDPLYQLGGPRSVQLALKLSF